MVVVYSGDSERPVPNWQAEPTPRGPATQASGPNETGPFLPIQEAQRSKLASGPGLFDAYSDLSPAPPPVEAVPVAPAAIADAEVREAAPGPEPSAAAVGALAVSAEIASGASANAAPVPGAVDAAKLDARNRPTVRVGRVSQRPPSMAPSAPASLGAAKALAARRSLTPSLPPPPVKPASVPRGILLGLLGVAAGLGLFLLQRARSRAEGETKPQVVAVVEPARSARAPGVLPPRAAPALEPAPEAGSARAAPELPPKAAGVAAASASEVPPAPVPGPNVASPTPSPAASAARASTSTASTKTVTLEVMPADSKVFTHGSLRKGPPYTFEIKPGGRVIVEVVRPGYVARRVVLDGSKPQLAVGLLRKRPTASSRARSEPSPTAASAPPPEQGNGVVQSGL